MAYIGTLGGRDREGGREAVRERESERKGGRLDRKDGGMEEARGGMEGLEREREEIREMNTVWHIDGEREGEGGKE